MEIASTQYAYYMDKASWVQDSCQRSRQTSGQSDKECHHEIFVLMRWERDGLAVPLAQLTIAYADDETRQAAGDWLYWVDRGYRF